MDKVKVKQGRPIKNFGQKLDKPQSFNLSEKEELKLLALCYKLDLPVARVIRQILFGITSPINLKEN